MVEPTGKPTSAAPWAIILAAGKGTRMADGTAGDTTSAVRPKVVYPVADRPMVCWVVDACRAAGVERCVIVVGYEADQVRDALAEYDDCVYVEQHEQLGTGHATRMAQPMFDAATPRDTFVLAGDGPLIRPTTLENLLRVHRETGAGATLATAVLDDPSGYGRVLRDEAGGFGRIVEQKDASPDERTVREVNPSYYCFRSDLLFDALSRVTNDNKQGEYYVTDVPAMLKAEGHTVSVVDAVPPDDVLSINTPAHLAQVDAIMRRRLATSGAAAAGGAGGGGRSSEHVSSKGEGA